MSTKPIQQPGSGRTFRFGRIRPIARGPRLRLSNYLMRTLPTPPPTCDYRRAAASALAKTYRNMDLNDCVIAGLAHLVGVLTGNAGTKPFLYSDRQIVTLYSAIGGYVPGKKDTDNGCDEQTALNYWENNGFPKGSNHKIAGWLAVNGNDPVEYKTALWLFENLFFGVEMPDEWVHPPVTKSGFEWDIAGAPNKDNGHCFPGVGYNDKGVIIATWGLTGLITDAAINKYATIAAQGDLYTVISHDAINTATQKAPNGFDWSQLTADFDSMGGSVSNSSPLGGKQRRK